MVLAERSKAARCRRRKSRPRMASKSLAWNHSSIEDQLRDLEEFVSSFPKADMKVRRSSAVYHAMKQNKKSAHRTVPKPKASTIGTDIG